MFNLLDIAYPGKPYRPPIKIDPDTVYILKPAKDSVIAPESTDSIIPKDVIDSCENVIDTLQSAINWLNGTAPMVGTPRSCGQASSYWHPCPCASTSHGATDINYKTRRDWLNPVSFSVSSFPSATPCLPSHPSQSSRQSWSA